MRETRTHSDVRELVSSVRIIHCNVWGYSEENLLREREVPYISNDVVQRLLWGASEG